jgi:RNA polymerase sigma-70 factor (ECF subfamily)
MTDPEEALVQSAKAGDRAAFEELVRRTSRLLFARLYLESGDSHRAEDLVQETLLIAYRSLDKLDSSRSFRPWLLKIAQNVAIDATRRELRKKRAAPPARGAEVLDQVAGTVPPPEELVQREELRQQVLAILRSLPEEYRLPLTLRYIGGVDYDSIGTQLGLSNGSLRGLLHRGLKLLRSKLQQTLGNDFVGE